MTMNLQFFAEGDGTGADDGNGDGAGNEPSNDSGKETPLSFDDFLKGEGNQAEFDRRVQQAITTAVSHAQEKWQLLTDDKVSEAEKLAKMNKDEKAEYMQKKKEKELSARELEITKRELMAEAKNTLAEKKLPVRLADLLIYTDAEACKTSLETLEQTFNEAVSQAVEEKLKGKNPPTKAPQSDEETLAKQIESLMRGR